MKRNFDDAYPLKTIEKTRKNLVWVLILSICMMFAGFTSAYIVSMGDSFWVKIQIPKAFYVSTVLIIISSLTLYLAVRAAKVNHLKNTRFYILLSLILGLGFGVSQFIGYSQLVKNGGHFISRIIVDDGRYGDYYELKKSGEYLTVENNQYYFQDEKIVGEEKEDFQNFAKQFIVPDLKTLQNQTIDMKDYTLLYKSEPLNYVNNEFVRPNGEKLDELDFKRLQELMINIRDDRADFFIRGELGKDFRIFYNKNELDYQERTLMYKGQPLSANLQNKLLRGNNDTSTSYFYIITILHLFHVVGGVVMLISLLIRSYTVKREGRILVALKVDSIFWHFLGILWIYLLLFLLFIH